MNACTLSATRHLASSLQLKGPAPARRGCRAAAGTRLCVAARLVLTPTGNGSFAHIGEEVDVPGPIDLKEGLFEVGRAPPVDIVIPIPTVSSRHAMLRVTGGAQVQVSDLGSTNGTFVDGKELTAMQAVPLPVGSQVTFGDEFLAVYRLDSIPDADAEAAPAEAAPAEAAPVAEAPAPAAAAAAAE